MESSRSPRRHVRSESFEQKCEHRAAKHEWLRDRNNATTCRSPSVQTESDYKATMRRKREKELLKRRGISGDADVTQVKVTLRENRRRAEPTHRQSLVVAQDLGITWPDTRALEQALWVRGHPLQDPVQEGSVSHNLQQDAPLRRNPEITARTGNKDQKSPSNRPVHVNVSSTQTESGCVTVKEEVLLQLAEYLQEALWREQMLKKKLALLQEGTSALLLSCDKMWRGGFKEDLLKCQIGALESQLQVCSQKFSRDVGKRLLLQMEEQRQVEEEKTLGALQTLTAEKSQAEEKVSSLERALQDSGDESERWRGLYQEQGGVIVQLRASLQQNSEQIYSLQDQLEKSNREAVDLRGQLQDVQDENVVLHNKLLHQVSYLQNQDLDQKEQECCFNTTSEESPSSRQQRWSGGLAQGTQITQNSTAQPAVFIKDLHLREEEAVPCDRGPSVPPQHQSGSRKGKSRPGCWFSFLLLLLLLAAAALWFHHHVDKEQLQDLYRWLEELLQSCLQEIASPQHPKCFKPI
ncbi:TRAF3-interacting JNK-activating modulator-like [Denticeps clupeoides]|uniref:Uncharacterized protein n=1 Tax=Denticeps clupeoides TaxID=299321 RepID=A0AAY4C9K5_9TELE|nr:TRAF3-interacting JNK-activating modulator [Denticeps clupeoides]